MSGYLSMSVPFLAAALAYGLSKATVLATSVLAVGQDAASSAAHESTTGNLSLANTGYDTHRFATLEGRQIRTSAHVDTDRYTGYAPAGAAMTVTGDGTVVADAGQATSRIPAAGVRLSESLATSHETRAAEARTLSRHWSAEAGEARNAAVTDATAMIERYSHDVSTGTAHARGITESESSQAQALESHHEKLAEIGGITKDQAAVLTGQARVGGGWDFIVKAGADGSVMWRGQTIESEAWNRIKEYDRQHGVTETWSQVADASKRYSTQTGDSEMASMDESLSANLTRMRSFQERASLSRQESESWSEQAAQVRSDAQAIGRDLGQLFFAWLSERKGTDGRALGAAGAMRIASPQTAEDSEQLREHAAAFIAEKYPAPAGLDPASVGGAAEYEGAAGELRGAYGRETAAAYGGWSAGVRDRAAAAGAPRPGETGAAGIRERAETETDLIVRGAARGARQTVTRDVAREGRAGVAAETRKPFEQHARRTCRSSATGSRGSCSAPRRTPLPTRRPARREETGPRTRRAGGIHRRDAGPAIAGGISPRASGVGAPRRRACRRRRRFSCSRTPDRRCGGAHAAGRPTSPGCEGRAGAPARGRKRPPRRSRSSTPHRRSPCRYRAWPQPPYAAPQWRSPQARSRARPMCSAASSGALPGSGPVHRIFASCPWPPIMPAKRGKGIPGAFFRSGLLRPGPCWPPPRGGMARNFEASLMRGFGGSTLRGGQTVFHSIRMWGQLFQAAMLFAAFMTVAVPAWNLWNRTTGAEWYAAGMFTLAEFKLTVGYAPDSGQEIRFADGTEGVMKIRDIVASMPAWRARERIKAEMFRSAWLGAKVGAGIIALFLAWFWYRGVQLSRRKRIRGAELVTAGELRRRMRPAHLRVLDRMPGAARLRPYSIAGIPYPERTETQHTIVSGTTGSGKTVLIADLVSQIRARGERCVIYDKMGSYTRSFFDPARDVLMNPLDARAPRWSPFLEARNPRDFDMMAAALIPQQKDTVDPFWVTAARQLFSNGAGVFWKQGVTENKVLVDHLLKTDLTALAKAMEGTVAQSIVDPENPKTALSVRAMLTAHLGALEFLPDEGKPFSIRDWIGKEDKDGFLFLTSRGDQHASLRGLISTWLEIAVNAMVTLAQDDGRRIWVILDELPTLHQVPSLQPGLAESRQFGGCFVLGVQVAAALRDLYGRNGAETISGLCGTRVVLAAPDRDTAQWSADSLGRSEVEEIAEGYSYGANTIRDGVSLTPKRELRALALPSEIMRLPNLEGYLKFPGPFPVASIRLKYVARGEAAARFVPREGDAAEAIAEPDDAAKAAEAPLEALPEDDGTRVPEPADDADADRGDMATSPEYPPEPALRQGELDLGPTGQGREETERKPDPQAEGEHRGVPSANGTGRAPGAGDMSPSAEDADERAPVSAEERDTGGWY